MQGGDVCEIPQNRFYLTHHRWTQLASYWSVSKRFVRYLGHEHGGMVSASRVLARWIVGSLRAYCSQEALQNV